MLIEKISVYHVSLPLLAPWKTAFGEEYAIDSVLVRIESGEYEGWGEAAPYATPQFSPEWTAGAFYLIRDVFAPLLEGQYVDSGAALQTLLARYKGNYFAKGAIDTAWWDLQAKIEEKPLWQLIGGKSAEVAVGADIPVQSDHGKLVEAVQQAHQHGFSRTKLKFRPDSGLAMIKAVRDAVPAMPIHIDCNSGFTLNDLPLFRELDKLGLTMIEQPLGWDDLIDHAYMQQKLETPICLDESIVSRERARKALDIDAARMINIKHGRVGGFTNALAIHDLCLARGVTCWIGGMLESFVGQGPSLALATLPGVGYASDIFPDGRLYATDLAEPALHLSGPGKMTAPDSPGHGFSPNPDRLKNALVLEG